jgi:hypothetical protein
MNIKVKSNTALAVRQDIYVGPNTKLPNPGIPQAFEDGTRIFAGFAQPKSFFAVYYRYADKDWAKSKLKDDLNSPNRAVEVDGSCSSTSRCNGASAGKASDTVGFSQFAVSDPGSTTDAYHTNGAIEIHEYTHIVQAMQFSGKPTDDRNFGYLPNWWIEGHAHANANLGASKTFEEYEANRRSWFNTSPNTEIRSFSAEDIQRFYDSLMPGKYNSEMFGYVYTIGYITLESLIALKGVDSPMQLVLDVSNGATFESAFARIYGMSWDAAKPILAASVSEQFLAARR